MMGSGTVVETATRMENCSFAFETTKQDDRGASGSGFSGSARAPMRTATSICVPRTRIAFDSRRGGRDVKAHSPSLVKKPNPRSKNLIHVGTPRTRRVRTRLRRAAAHIDGADWGSARVREFLFESTKYMFEI
jgi:hypothetical protein